MTSLRPISDPITPYRYVGGDPALDFVNTVDWTDRGLVKDRFTGYARLLEWAEGAAILAPAELEGLRTLAARDEYAAAQVVSDAVALRELLERTFSRQVRGRAPDPELAELNSGWLRRSLSELELVRVEQASPENGDRRRRVRGGRRERNEDRTGGRRAPGAGSPALTPSAPGRLALGWPRAAQALESPLWVVAWSTARLFASDEVARIRRCAGIDCGWYYVDRSRNGLRRWCEMETCGVIMKTRRRAERNARTRSAGG